MAKTTKLNDTEIYKHKSAKRKNNPTEQTEPHMDDDQRVPQPFQPEMLDRDDKPRLAWQRFTQPTKAHDSFPLYTREKLHPGLFARWLQYGAEVEGSGLMSLWHDFNGFPSEDAKFEWYQHEINWSNRLIHGESAQVISSLIANDNMAGQVQMIYFDPPYGDDFKANFQPLTTSTTVKDNDKVNDSYTIRAFRDTYEREIHSYLDLMYEKLVLCRNLLADTGSIFLQIGDENIHRLAIVMDEVFRPENRVATIPFVTTGGSSSKTLSSVADFLLWYAKDKSQVKFNQLYEPMDEEEKILISGGWATGVEFADGSSRGLTTPEREGGWADMEEDCKFFKMTPITSQGEAAPGKDGERGRSEPYIPKGHALVNERGIKSIPCSKGRHWSVSHEGLERLEKINRLHLSSDGKTLHWKFYMSEMPGRRIHNVWQEQSSERNKRYVVQTAEKIIRRAMLMATDPGDLVFDPTCGGGTTAVVAEEWGRRWITCDTSPIAISLARQRIATRAYPYWVLADSLEGRRAEIEILQKLGGDVSSVPTTGGESKDPAKGFVYKRVPYVTAKRLAYDLPQIYTCLVDQPVKNKGKVRVASPFSVESTSGVEFEPFAKEKTDPEQDSEEEYLQRVVNYLKRDGATDSKGNVSFEIVDITELDDPSYVTHEVEYRTDGGTATAGMMLVGDEARASRISIQQAATETRKHFKDAKVLFVVAFESEMGSKQQGKDSIGNVRVVHIRPNRDLAEAELKESSGHRAFTIQGEPDIAVHQSTEEEGWIEVEVLGFDVFDPRTGETEHHDGNSGIACWMLDINFDGTSFYAHRIHFPADGEDDLKKLAGKLKVSKDSLRYLATLSTRSAPFPPPTDGHGVAVRVITASGDESTVEIDI